jgi:hypothetical protein
MDEIRSYKMCAVKVRNAKLRNYLKKSWKSNGTGESVRSTSSHTLFQGLTMRL